MNEHKNAIRIMAILVLMTICIFSVSSGNGDNSMFYYGKSYEVSEWTPYHLPSAAHAAKLCKAAKNDTEKYNIITNYITNTIAYDYIREIQVTGDGSNNLPDIAYVWKNRMGICTDISALAVNMLRAVGIRCYICIGSADGYSHAWVQAYIGNEIYLYDHEDPNGKIQEYIIEYAV